MTLNDASALPERLSRLVKDKGYVTFVEITREFPDEHGEFAMCFPQNPSIMLWWGMSEKLVRTITQLLADDVIHIHPATELTYLADGAVPSYPIAKSLREYKKPRWYPVCFHDSAYKGK